MITLLDTLGPAIWRASWQAAALALLVVLLTSCFGERLSPRWRFLLRGVVLARLLFVVTPVSPWSVFNLVRWNPQANARPIAQREADATFQPVPHGSDSPTGPYATNAESPRVAGSAPESTVTRVTAPPESPSISSGTTMRLMPSLEDRFDAVSITRILSLCWLAGCLFLGLKLLGTALILRRRLSACRPVTLPRLELTVGGFITGQVVNTVTGRPVFVSEGGEPIKLSLFGPSEPSRLTAVDKTGRFVLRAAPGENFPYFVNTRGARMAWDTRQQPPVVVKDGETTRYNMLITPEVSPAEKRRAARKLVAALSRQPYDRTAQILVEYRKLSHTVDEEELWCLLMRELVAVGRDAVPQLCAELDRTTEDRALRRLGFALRAIGDPRAVPALIRAIPKTLLPSSSDYGLNVIDKELMDFMLTHDLRKEKGREYFDLGRPSREIIGALHGLTGQNLQDAEVLGMALSEDPRRQVLQRRIYRRHAQQWQAWWEANWRTYTADPVYQKVNLKVGDETLTPASLALGKTARLSGGLTGAVLSPATQESQFAWLAYDLDTGSGANWPARIPRDDPARDPKQLEEWASQSGVDLICVSYRSPGGAETDVLRALGMKVREIHARDLRNLDRLLAAGTLPEGRPVGDLLMHYDTQSQQFVPDANAAFLFITREGNMGVIETTDASPALPTATETPPARRPLPAHRQAPAPMGEFDSI